MLILSVEVYGGLLYLHFVRCWIPTEPLLERSLLHILLSLHSTNSILILMELSVINHGVSLLLQLLILPLGQEYLATQHLGFLIFVCLFSGEVEHFTSAEI